MENRENMPSVTLAEFDAKVQEYLTQLEGLRAEGTEKIKNLSFENKTIKLKKNLDKETKEKIINSNNQQILNAKEVAKGNAEQLKSIVTEAIAYIKETYAGIYAADKAVFNTTKANAKAKYAEDSVAAAETFTANLKKLTETVTDAEKLKKETAILKEEKKLAMFEAKKLYNDTVQKAKDELHASYLHKDHMISLVRDGKRSIVETVQNSIEAFIYQFNTKEFFMKNGLYLIILAFMIICIIKKPSLVSMPSNWLILKNWSTRVFFALGVAGLILLAGTDLSVGRMVTLSTMFTCMILNPTTSVEFFGLSFNGVYANLGFGGALIVAFLISIALCVMFSLIAGFFTAKFKIHPFISTLGTSLVIWGLVGFSTNNIKTGTISDAALAIGNTTLGPVPITIIYAIVAIAIVWFIWNKTKFGKNMYAVGGNPEAAEVSGISVFKVTLGVFMMAGILYGIGGFFQATVTGSSSSSFGQGWELEAIAACVIGGISFTGGIGKIRGAVIGCLLFEILKYYLRGVFGGSADISNIFIGVIILVAVTFDSIKYLKKK